MTILHPRRWRLVLLTLCVLASLLVTALPQVPLGRFGAGMAEAAVNNISKRTTASTDDCLMTYNGSAWTFITAGTYQIAGYLYSTVKYRGGGMRFRDVDIPAGATITAATITFTANLAYSNDNMKTRFRCELDGTPDTFSDLANYESRYDSSAWGGDFSQVTSAVDWDFTTNWVVDSTYTSPSLVSIVQSLVDTVGNVTDIVIFWDDHLGAGTQADYTQRAAYNYDGSATKAPLLSITYQGACRTVYANEPTDITDTSATLNGDTDCAGTYVAFVYDTESRPDPGNVAPGSSGYLGTWTSDVGSYSGAFDASTDDGNLTLSADTTYYVRAAVYDGYWGYSEERMFCSGGGIYSCSQEWLSGWEGGIRLLAIPNCYRLGESNDFAAAIYLGNSSGITDYDTTAIFDELGSNLNRFKIAITDINNNQLPVEIEKWDTASESAILHTKISSETKRVYLYADATHADNVEYVKDYNPQVWSSYNFVSHLDEIQAPNITISNQTNVFDASDAIGAGHEMEDSTVIPGNDSKYYMFVDDYTGSAPLINLDVYCISADDPGFTSNVTYHGKIIDRDYTRVFGGCYDPVRQEYILYLTDWKVWAGGNTTTLAYYCSKANFEAGDAGVGDWVNAGTVLSNGAVGTWDDNWASIFDVEYDSDIGNWTAYYQGYDGTSTIGIGMATSSDPRAAFSKSVNNPQPLITTSNVGSSWHNYGLDSAVRAKYSLNDQYDLFAFEGKATYWSVGLLLQPKSDHSALWDTRNSPQLSGTVIAQYANPDDILNIDGTIYFYYQIPWSYQYVATLSESTTFGDALYNYSVMNSKDLDYRFIKKTLNEPDGVSTGKIYEAQNFDGTNDYIGVAHSSALTPGNITVSFYFNLDVAIASQPDADAILLQKYVYVGNSGYGVYILKADSTINWRAYINGAWQTLSYAPAISAGTWYRFDGTFDGRYMHMYLDGVEIGTAIDVGSGGYSITQNTRSLYLGIYDGPGNTASNFDGSIDELRIMSSTETSEWRDAEIYSAADSLFTFVDMICISNTPSSHDFSVVGAGQTIWSKTNTSTPPGFLLAAGNCTGNVTNVGIALDAITVKIGDFSDGTSINIVSTAPGANEARLTIFTVGAGNDTDGLILTNAAQNFSTTVAADEVVYWELKLEIGTYTDYTEKTGNLTFETDPAGDSEVVVITFTPEAPVLLILPLLTTSELCNLQQHTGQAWESQDFL